MNNLFRNLPAGTVSGRQFYTKFNSKFLISFNIKTLDKYT